MARGAKLVLLAAFLLVASAVPGSAQPKPVNWDFLSIVGLTHPVGEYHKQFTDEARKRTGGQVNITVRPAGELPYKVSEALRVTGQGSVQLADGYVGFLAGDTKIGVLTGLPFLVGTSDELNKAMTVLEPLVREDFARFGDDILYWYTWPPQNVYGRGKPIMTLEDFKGRKIRTTSPEQSELMKRLGAVPVSLTGPEVPSAAQRGIMEGVITAGFNLLGWKWYEFCEWGYLPDVHIGGPSYIIVNKAALAALSPENQKQVKDVAAEFQTKMLKEIPARELADRQILEQQHHVKMHTASAEDVQRARKLMEPYWDEWAKQAGPKVVEALAQVRKTLGR